MKKLKKITMISKTAVFMLTLLLLMGCQTSNNEETAVTTPVDDTPIVTESTPSQPADSSYPTTSSSGSAYPGQSATIPPEGVLSELPNPQRDIPAPESSSGSVGGFLVRVEAGGYIPVTPQALYLGRVLSDDQGRQSVIARSADSQQATLLSTGVFVFDNIPPGTYGLVLDIALAEFPALAENGQPLLIEVEAGKALDLGAVIVELP